MDAAFILGAGLGVLAPAAMLAGCVAEAMAFRLAKDPRCDKNRLQKRYRVSDVALVAAWLLLAAAYLAYKALSGGADDTAFVSWMTWVLGALLLLDVYYLYLRRARPRKPGQKKHFWEI